MSTVIDFPGTSNNFSKMHLEPVPELLEILEETEVTHHTEVFEYSDDSFVLLIQPKGKEFSVERMVFMAERLKMTLFDALPCYDEDELGTQDDPSDDV